MKFTLQEEYRFRLIDSGYVRQIRVTITQYVDTTETRGVLLSQIRVSGLHGMTKRPMINLSVREDRIVRNPNEAYWIADKLARDVLLLAGGGGGYIERV